MVFAVTTFAVKLESLSLHTIVFAVIACVPKLREVFISLVRTLHTSNVSVTATFALATPGLYSLFECDYTVILLILAIHHEVLVIQ